MTEEEDEDISTKVETTILDHLVKEEVEIILVLLSEEEVEVTIVRVCGLSSFVPHRLVCKTCVGLVPHRLVCKNLCLTSVIYRDTL